MLMKQTGDGETYSARSSCDCLESTAPRQAGGDQQATSWSSGENAPVADAEDLRIGEKVHLD